MYRGEEMPSFFGVKHRGRLQIVMDVLKAIIEEDKPTRIMYRSNLAWDRMIIALDLLEQRGLISSKRMGSRSRFFITESGMEALSRYDNFTKLLMFDV